MELRECLKPCKIIEIQGEESTGKTTLALKLAKAIQDAEGLVIYVDVDHKLNLDLCKQLVDIDNLYILESNTTEEILELLNRFSSLNIVSAVIIDSVGSLRGLRDTSKEVSRFLTELSMIITKAKAACILINQYRFFNNAVMPMYDKIMNLYTSVRVRTDYIDEEYTSTVLKNRLQSFSSKYAL
jgi:recombination protein RecA